MAKQGITVNRIGAGIIWNSTIKPVNPPASRFAGYDDVRDALGFFMSPQSDCITGSPLNINGD